MPDPRRRERGNIQLTLGADIQQARAESDGDRKSGKDQRRREEQRVADAIGPPQRAADQQAVGLEGIVADRSDEHAADGESRDDSDDGKQQDHGRTAVMPLPPVINQPISSESLCRIHFAGDAAFMNHQQTIRQRRHLFQFRRHEQDGAARVTQRHEFAVNELDRADVDAARRLRTSSSFGRSSNSRPMINFC